MTKLGKGLFDDPAYTSATLEPSTQDQDIGTPTNPYQDGYFSGTVNAAALINTSIEYSSDPFLIYADTTDGADTKSAAIVGGGAKAVTRGSWIEVFGNEDTGTGKIDIHTGNIATSHVNLFLENAASKFIIQTGAGTALWSFLQTGTLLYTSGSAGIFANTADAADNLTLRLGGGGSLASTRGAAAYLQGNEAGGSAAVIGGAIATGHVDLQLTHASALIRVVNSSGLVAWSISDTGVLTSDATSGGSLVFAKATSGVQLQSGANGRTGTFTLNGATPVVVSNTSLAAGDMIVIERDTIGGTPLAYQLTSRTNATGFSVTGTATDTSGMRYFLVRVN